ncbi:Polyadenylate-binding protein 2 [Rhynchospora pubera]|uniref:Polyadenylate-binding protein 2 n=1 Tax=Rhynchospora pubera TaxID=906938 RepID=A0AAV8H2X4_9POAL|nr:Polyadenylate-binding protein 2 [Rhynchospora pubera]
MTKLYIANLPQCFTADELIQLFVRFGSIEKAKMVTEKTDGVNKSYGLVKFADVAHADKALKEMNGYLLEGKELYVNIVGLWKQIDATDLYVGNLPLHLNKNGLCSLFEKFGSIVQANVVVDEAGVSKGYGFIKFEDPAIAARATACMNGLALEDKVICVRIAGAAPEHAAKVAAQMTTEVIQQRDEANLYVSN